MFCEMRNLMHQASASRLYPGSPAASPDSSDNSDTHHSGGSDMEMDEQMMGGSKRGQQRLSDTEVSSTPVPFSRHLAGETSDARSQYF